MIDRETVAQNIYIYEWKKVIQKHRYTNRITNVYAADDLDTLKICVLGWIELQVILKQIQFFWHSEVFCMKSSIVILVFISCKLQKYLSNGINSKKYFCIKYMKIIIVVAYTHLFDIKIKMNAI